MVEKGRSPKPCSSLGNSRATVRAAALIAVEGGAAIKPFGEFKWNFVTGKMEGEVGLDDLETDLSVTFKDNQGKDLIEPFPVWDKEIPIHYILYKWE